MSDKFVCLVNGVEMCFNNVEDIPMVIDNLISFAPEYIPPPHTEAEHDINASWINIFKELLTRESM